MDQVDPFDQPLGEPVEGVFNVFDEEEDKKALKLLLERNKPLVNEFADRIKAAKTKAKSTEKDRDEEEVDLAIEMLDHVFCMRMTFHNLLQNVGTVFPLQLVADMKKLDAATCLDDLENVFGPTEIDIDELVKSGGRLADLLEKFPMISLKDDKTKLV